MASIADTLGTDLRTEDRIEEMARRPVECARDGRHRGPIQETYTIGKSKEYQCGYCLSICDSKGNYK